MTPQQANLAKAIDEAYIDVNRILAYEIDTGISEEVEKRGAEEFASGLSSAYFMVYGDHYLSTVAVCDEDNYKQWLN
jgi:hypothetical protein